MREALLAAALETTCSRSDQKCVCSQAVPVFSQHHRCYSLLGDVEETIEGWWADKPESWDGARYMCLACMHACILMCGL